MSVTGDMYLDARAIEFIRNKQRRPRKFLGTPDDFVSLVSFLESTKVYTTLNQPSTRTQIARQLMARLDIDMGGYKDYTILDQNSRPSAYGFRFMFHLLGRISIPKRKFRPAEDFRGWDRIDFLRYIRHYCTDEISILHRSPVKKGQIVCPSHGSNISKASKNRPQRN